MSYVLTLVAAEEGGLPPPNLMVFQEALADLSLRPVDENGPTWLAPYRAADLKVLDRPSPDQMARLRAVLAEGRVDLFVTDQTTRRDKKLLLADMDATIVVGETLDELAARAGVKDQVAALTTRAMRGELDFRSALAARLALIKGVPEHVLRDVVEAQTLTQGTQTLIATLRRFGVTCVLVSGGFTFFTESVAARAGFDAHHGNLLLLQDGRVAGEVADPVLGADAKLGLLQDYQARLGLAPHQTLAIGDGANDLPMLQAAGLGVGFQPKPLLRERLDNLILYGDLTALLFALGFHANEFVTSP